jgi:2-dehydropantoate 2-reductase
MAEVIPPMKIAVLGPGAIGSLLAALLSRSGNQVYCIGSEHAVESILGHGIRVKSEVFGDFEVYPISSMVASFPVDIVFITVKAPFLRVALGSISGCIGEKTVVVTLLNGIGHRELIRVFFGTRVVVGMIGAVEVALDYDRIVQHRSSIIPHLDIASDSDVNMKTISAIASTLRNSGLSVGIGANENEVIWKKLVRLAAIASLTTYSTLHVGMVRTNKQLRGLLESIVAELCEIAGLQGVHLFATDVMFQIDSLPATLTTSMQRDFRMGIPSEIESIMGEPIRLGEALGLSLPVLRHCYTHIKEQVYAKKI